MSFNLKTLILNIDDNINNQLINLQTQINNKQDAITGGASLITNNNLNNNIVPISNSSGKITSSTTTSTELSFLNGLTQSIQTSLNNKLNIPSFTGGFTALTTTNGISESTTTATELSYLNGVSSNIQTQLSNKQNLITGAASLITNNNLNNDIVPISNNIGKITSSSTTSTELSYLNGVSSNIQTQINNIVVGTSLNFINMLTLTTRSPIANNVGFNLTTTGSTNFIQSLLNGQTNHCQGNNSGFLLDNANFKFNCIKDGQYKIEVQANLQPTATADGYLFLRLNGATATGGFNYCYCRWTAGASWGVNPSLIFFLDCFNGDYFDIIGRAATSNFNNLMFNGSSICITRLGNIP